MAIVFLVVAKRSSFNDKNAIQAKWSTSAMQRTELF